MTDCILWMGAKNDRGYGHRIINGKTKLVHRLAYEAVYGPIPQGLEIDHLCRVRHCINPDHLEAVTHLENVRRGDHSKAKLNGARNAAKTHCPHGHPYAGDNLIVVASQKGIRRFCRTCKLEALRKSRIKRRDAAYAAGTNIYRLRKARKLAL